MSGLKIVFPICCGVDVHRDFIVACIATTDAKLVTTYQKRRFSTYKSDLMKFRDWLITHNCFDVCMESTGKYWIPVHNVLENYKPNGDSSRTFNVVVSHPKYVKSIKGKKTDLKDAEWISDVFKFDIVRGSFIPPSDIRQLRDLCRYYVKLTSCMTGEKNRAQNCLTVSNFKLDGVFSNVFGKSASAIIDYMLDHPGEKFDVAPFVNRRCKTPIKQIQEAVDTDFDPMQAEKLKIIKQHMSNLDARKNELEKLILRLAEPYKAQINLLLSVPGIAERMTAIRIIAEIGCDMTVFESAKRLASWAGLAPQNNESAGKKKTTRIGKAGAYIKPLFIQIAIAASRCKNNPEVSGKYQALKKRRGAKKAKVAIARRLLTAIFHMLLKNEVYNGQLYQKVEKAPVQRTLTPEQALMFLRKKGFVIIDPATQTVAPPDDVNTVA